MQSSLYGIATNAAEALKTVEAHKTPRTRELECLERHVAGTAYEGQVDFFADSDTPLWDRAPCIVDPIFKSAVSSNVDLVFGEQRFPDVTTNPGEDDSDADGLDEEQSKKVDRAISELFAKVRFCAVSRQALAAGQSAKSAAVIVGVRSGRPFLELVKAAWCEPTFGPRGEVVALEIKYPYVKWARDPQSPALWKLTAMLYRRRVDATNDITFAPVPARTDGVPPPEAAWIADVTVPHKLGFCPVVWYAFMKDCGVTGEYDGHAIHEDVLDEKRQLDIALSQRHQAAVFCGGPQIIEAGVAKGYNPGASGNMPSGAVPGGFDKSGRVTSYFGSAGSSGGGESARRKHPGIVWQYEDASTKVEYLVLPESAVETLDEDAADIRNKISEALAVVLLDPQNVKFQAAMSGKAIEQLRSRQFDRCDQIRDDVAEGWVKPVSLMLLRVALKAGVRMKAVVAVKDILSSLVEGEEAGETMLFVKWPAGYLRPDPQDEQFTVTAVVAALGAKAITRRMALEKLASIFSIGNIDQALDALDEEAQTALETAMALAGPPGQPGEDGGEAKGDGESPGKPAAGARPGAKTKGAPAGKPGGAKKEKRQAA